MKKNLKCGLVILAICAVLILIIVSVLAIQSLNLQKKKEEVKPLVLKNAEQANYEFKVKNVTKEQEETLIKKGDQMKCVYSYQDLYVIINTKEKTTTMINEKEKRYKIQNDLEEYGYGLDSFVDYLDDTKYKNKAVKEEEVNQVKCLVVEAQKIDGKGIQTIWFNKENGLPVKLVITPKTGESIEFQYEVKLDTAQEINMPNLEGFTKL